MKRLVKKGKKVIIRLLAKLYESIYCHSTSVSLKARKVFIITIQYFSLHEQFKFHVELSMKKVL